MRLPFFVGGSYVSRSPNVDPEDCVNWFVEQTEAPGAKARIVHYPTPGFTSAFSSVTYDAGATSAALPGFVRGMLAADSPSVVVSLTSPSTLFFAAGNQVFQYPYFTATQPQCISTLTLGTGILVDANPVKMAWSGVGGQELLVCSGGAVYRWRPAIGTWDPAPVLAASRGIITIGFKDSFFLALDSTTTLRISESFDGGTWDATQIVARTAQTDPWIAMLVVHDDIWLFGTRTTDVYWNAGTSPFPFQPRDGVSIQQGIAAAYSVAELDNAPIWLGRSLSGDGVVFRAQGYVPQRVSTFALEAAISRYTTISDAEGESFLIDGHWFYLLTFPSANASWLYDASNGIWTRVGYWNRTLMQYDAIRLRGHAMVDRTHYVGDRSSAAVFTMSTAVSTDFDGQGVRRMRRTPILSAEGVRLFFRSVQIDLESGLGLASGQGSDPQVMLRWSDDGGKTWGNEHWQSAGALGTYGTRVIWDRLGSGRNRVFEVAVSDPIPWRLADAYLTVEQGLH